MSDRVRFLMSIRARLILLLSGFLLLTMFLVVGLDSWSRSQGRASLAEQQQQVKHAVDEGYGDFAQAIGAAIHNLDSNEFLFDQIENKKLKLPDSVEHI